MNFVDNQSDLNTVNYMAKSIQTEILEKALSHSGLVQKDIQYRTHTGKIATRRQWVRVGEEQKITPVKSVKEERKQLPATPFNITDKLKHLVPITSVKELPEHIQHLDKPIPPTWRNVMISTDPTADILAVGKDDMDRPQYIYSKECVEKGKAEKFERIQSLIGKRDELVSFIQRIEDKDTSDCLNLILYMGIRPGSTRDTKAKIEALGATTLRGENVVMENSKVFLRFTGKKGVSQNHKVPEELEDMLIERKIKAGDDGDLFETNDTKLRIVLKPFGIKPKDLRTMLATDTAQKILEGIPPTNDAKEFAKVRNRVGDEVCKILGNQRSMALNAYIDPMVFKNWSKVGFSNWENKTNEEVES